MASRALVLRAATVVTPAVALSPGEVVLEAGRLAAVRTARRGPAPPPGTVLAPGFVDLQVNGAGRQPVVGACSDAAWAALGGAMAAGGTTTWCPAVVTAPPDLVAATLMAAERARAPRPGRPTIAGVHLEGPMLTVPGAHRADLLAGAVPPDWAAGLPPAVRVVTLAPELPGALAAVAELAGRGVLVALGHSACTAEVAAEAADAGARLVTHLGNAMGPFHQRQPGLLGAALADPRLTVSIVGDLEHVHPAVVRLAFAAKGPERVALVTDRVADGGLLPPDPAAPPAPTPPGPATGAGGPTLARRAADGVLTGTTATMVDLVDRCAALPGLRLTDVVTAATATPARLLGLNDRGRLVPGARADVVGLCRSPRGWRVAAVWIGGRRSTGGATAAPGPW